MNQSTQSRETSADVNLLYTDVEDSLRDSVRSLLADRCPADRVIAAYDGDHDLGAELWPTLATDLGLAGLLVPEDMGGQGASAREAAVVLEELGRFAAPVPFLTSAVIATSIALRARETELVRKLAAGTATAALAVPFSSGAATFGSDVLRTEEDVLRGSVANVAGAHDADILFVPVPTEAGFEVHLVDVSEVTMTSVVSLDMTRRLADIEFMDAPCEVLIDATDGAAAVRDALELGAALLASEQVGVAEWCLESTVAYLKERRQFGRIVGGFQAIKHRLADLWVEVESARAAARYAAATAADGDPDRRVATSLAQAYCSGAAVHAAEECVQLHGGIGMTWEHPAHLYLKRAKADQLAFGTAEGHRATLAGLVDLQA
ncbi:acyl-CoA dehydrogenase family protein [Haloechinothrix halophila]|uniref:acyl-CoA dehydrogenase family protein n=1 Tax=Haloechinothrix halophila TaxID=1069073 RepID=UPI00068772DD|nr:acyl-CoA dehydrogenase family protein [Haloechinothrix halophila]